MPVVDEAPAAPIVLAMPIAEPEPAQPRVPSRHDIGHAFTVRQKLKMRTQCELTSDEAGELLPGTEIVLMTLQKVPDGTLRAHVASAPPGGGTGRGAPLGWVSCVSKADGISNMIPLERVDASKAAAAAERAAAASSMFSTQPPPPPDASAAAGAVKPAELYRGGSLVKLNGTKSLENLEKFDGRMGRVVEMARGWSKDNNLVAVLLDSRPTDYHRGAGTWVAVPPEFLSEH